MNSYYISTYLNCIPLQNSYLLFNGFNGCIDEVSKEFGYFLEKNAVIEQNKLISQSDINFLLKRGHVTTLNKNEEYETFEGYVKKLDDLSFKENESKGNIMLLLSYDCNLDCYYCYQKQIRGKKGSISMDEEFITRLFEESYDKLFPNVQKDKIDITLYGGEPFLEKNRKAIEKTLFYAERYGLYTGSISNSTQIDKFLDLMGPLPGMVNFVQVSLDGDKTNHDKSRISLNRKPTFDLIVDNVHKLLDKKVKVNIRINIESNSLHQIDNLYKFLEEEEILEHPYSYVYLHPLHNHFKQTDGEKFLDHKNVGNTLEEMAANWRIRHPIRRKADGLKYIFELERGIPFSKTRFCMQNYPNNYVIDPYGDLYACYEEAGRKEFKIGRVVGNTVEYNDLRTLYYNRSILNMPECLKCSVALLCGGECGVQAREENGDIFKPFCNLRKYEIYEAIKYLYKDKYECDSIDCFNSIVPNL